ncbi:hypothetical protein BHE74_00036838 [Ensete ventricosum]|nr:hypothetical protein BHE74_00036838 [Ensete ventricosum]
MGCIGCTGCSSSAAWSLTGSSAPAAFPVIQLQGFKAEKTRKGMGVKDTSGEGRGDLSRQETGMRLRRDKRRLVARRTAWLGELIVTRSCHRAMSSDRELSGVELRCRPDLFSSECASSPLSMGVGTSDVGWSFLGDLRPERRSVVPRVVLGPMILHTGLFETGRGDPMRPLQRPSQGRIKNRPPGRVRLRVLGREFFPTPFTCCRNGCFIPVGGSLFVHPALPLSSLGVWLGRTVDVRLQQYGARAWRAIQH